MSGEALIVALMPLGMVAYPLMFLVGVAVQSWVGYPLMAAIFLLAAYGQAVLVGPTLRWLWRLVMRMWPQLRRGT